MQISAKSVKWLKITSSVLCILVTEDNWRTEISQFNDYFKNSLLKFLKAENFSGKFGELSAFYTSDLISSPIILISGLGKQSEFTSENLRNLIAKITRHVNKTQKPNFSLDLNFGILMNKDPENMASIITEGVLLGNYKFIKYQNQKQKTYGYIENVYLLTTPAKIQHVANGIDRGQLIAAATNFARNLVNEPGSINTPVYLADVAKKIAKKSPRTQAGNIKIEVYDEKQIRKLGMTAYLAVARGSNMAPKMIKLTYKSTHRPKNNAKEKVVLIGKSLTFDSGGLSLKDAKSMENMKLDMAGGAAVLAIFSILEKLKPKVDVIGLLPACENMPGSGAVKPGDIVTAKNGKTIEVVNTDAEGRLTLADALSLATDFKPTVIIDLATLTGACVSALGEDIAGIFSNNEKLKQNFIQAGKDSDEKFWELPLVKEYRSLIKSDIADLRNISKSKYGGAITAALFLQEFVGNVPWLHIDIAGPAWAENGNDLTPRGGSGFGVRTLIQYLTQFSK